MYARYSTTLSKCYFFYCPDFAIYIFKLFWSLFVHVLFSLDLCTDIRMWIPVWARFLLFTIPWIMYTFSCCFYVTAQSNIRQLPVSLQKSPPSKIKSIRPYSSFQPEPVPFRNAITSAWYARWSSVPSSFICPSPVPLYSNPRWSRWLRPHPREFVMVAPQ